MFQEFKVIDFVIVLINLICLHCLQHFYLNISSIYMIIFRYVIMYFITSLFHVLQDCGSVPAMFHGRYVMVSANVTTFGAEADVICDAGYDASELIVLCLENGTWATATCDPKGSYISERMFKYLPLISVISSSSTNI